MSSSGATALPTRLRHLSPLAVHHEAVREDRLVGRRARACPPPPAARSGTSRGAGPSPRGTCRPASAAPGASPAPRRGCSPSRTRRRGCRSPCGTPSPPHFGARACPAGRSSRPRAQVPLVGARALAARSARHVLDERARSRSSVLAALAVEGQDRHAPHALARDGPVGAVRDHVVDALLAPARDPLHVACGSPSSARCAAAPCLVERDEPLLGGAEERRVLAAPAVRIGVRRAAPRRAARRALGGAR